MSEPVLCERDGDLVTLTLNRPDSRNPLTDREILDGLNAACDRIRNDVSVRCVILTGSGRAFSAGGNLKHMRERSEGFAGSAADVREHYRRGIQRTTRAVFDLDVPTICAVNGPAYGAGCDMTLACDIRICTPTAVFAENFVKVGLVSGDGGSWLLPRAIGLSRASEMSFTGEPVDADTALAWGLVSRVVAADDLLDEARRIAGRITVNPPQQLRMAKRLIREGQKVGFESLLELAASFQGACHHTADHEEALTAIFEKRTPRFRGE